MQLKYLLRWIGKNKELLAGAFAAIAAICGVIMYFLPEKIKPVDKPKTENIQHLNSPNIIGNGNTVAGRDVIIIKNDSLKNHGQSQAQPVTENITTNITVKDSAKVGTVISGKPTGPINIEQNF